LGFNKKTVMDKTSIKIKKVAFFGDAEANEKEESFRLAFRTAELLAKKGYIVVNGGGPGIMLAATLGAKQGQGLVEIVVIKEENEPGNYEGTSLENVSKADKKYETKNITDRTEKLVEIADAFLIFKGGTGTLAEAGMVWELAKFNHGHHEPLIFIGKEWGEVIRIMEKEMEFEKVEKRVVTTVETAQEAVKAIELAGKRT
jgi:uncharacterized protein (TIGR00725 family)